MIKTDVPYWRLSGFYFVYFASLGILVPFWSLYLKSLNFDARQIGELIAIIMATKIVAPYLWGWIADHTGRGMLVVRMASIFAFAIFSLIFVSQEYWWLAIVMMGFSFFWNAALPQFEATTMTYLGENTHRYSMIRVWGSLGFIGSVVILGEVLEHTEVSLVPKVLFLIFGAIMLSSFSVPGRQLPVQQHQHVSISQVLRQPVVLALIAVCFLVQFSHGPYYTFYTIYLEEVGYQRGEIGWLWALGVFAEVVLFLYMHRLLPKYGPRLLLLLALALTALRWLLIGYLVDVLAVVLFAQLLHAASFGLFHAVSISLFHRLFTGKHQGRGQALYSSVSFGAGGAAGSLLSGLSWDLYDPQVSFTLAAVAALLAYAIARRYIRV